MDKKEGENPVIISNFEIYKSKNKVVLYINPKIFPVSIINKTASLFKDNAWITIDGHEDEILVELRPRNNDDLELLARKFNNELLEQSTNEIKTDNKSNALLSRVKEVVAEFIREEQGRISKQSILTISTILATLGLAGIASASHFCGDSDGSDGGGACCFISGTKILMADSTTKNIEEVKIDDIVFAFDMVNKEVKPAKVLALESPIREGYYVLNKGLLRVTDEHPIHVRKPNGKEGWASINPIKTIQDSNLRPILDLSVGDEILTVNVNSSGELLTMTQLWIKITSIEYVRGPVQTYNLKSIQDYKTFFADNVLVHNKDCCFIAGTKILMADGSLKNIEEVKVGNIVKSFNEKNVNIEDKKVLSIDTPIHDDMIRLNFENGISNTNTQDHPYYVKEKGWCSYKPKLTLERYNISAQQLEEGDVVYYYEDDSLKEIKLTKITEQPGEVQTYNLRVEDNHTYFANNVVVHNKDGPGCD